MAKTLPNWNLRLHYCSRKIKYKNSKTSNNKKPTNNGGAANLLRRAHFSQVGSSCWAGLHRDRTFKIRIGNK